MGNGTSCGCNNNNNGRKTSMDMTSLLSALQTVPSNMLGNSKGGYQLLPLTVPLLNTDGTGVGAAVAAGTQINMPAVLRPILTFNNVQRFPAAGLQVQSQPLAWPGSIDFDPLQLVPEGGRAALPLIVGGRHYIPATQVQTTVSILGNVAAGTRVSVTLWGFTWRPWGDASSFCQGSSEDQIIDKLIAAAPILG